jgi:hypothetical protein
MNKTNKKKNILQQMHQSIAFQPCSSSFHTMHQIENNSKEPKNAFYKCFSSMEEYLYVSGMYLNDTLHFLMNLAAWCEDVSQEHV